jgi:shikimate-5-dehydrogenase
LTPEGRRAAVLGSPIAHSLSPVLHNAVYAALGLDGWRYTAHECRESELAPLVRGLGPEWVGLSLTMPLKRVALDVADEVSERAVAIGAANTLLLGGGADGMGGGAGGGAGGVGGVGGGARRADNTDAPGMVDALREAGVTAVMRAVVLGAGGTAQAGLAALAELTAEPVTVVVRDPDRAGALRGTAERLGVEVRVARFADVEPLLAAADLVLSTVPKGAADALAGAAWATGAVVFDVVYDPWPTPLAAGAMAAGCRVVSGLDLLLHQAGHQVTLMTGRAAPLAAMRAALHRPR